MTYIARVNIFAPSSHLSSASFQLSSIVTFLFPFSASPPSSLLSLFFPLLNFTILPYLLLHLTPSPLHSFIDVLLSSFASMRHLHKGASFFTRQRAVTSLVAVHRLAGSEVNISLISYPLSALGYETGVKKKVSPSGSGYTWRLYKGDCYGYLQSLAWRPETEIETASTKMVRHSNGGSWK